MSRCLLEQILDDLVQRQGTASISVQDVALDATFIVVRLSNGCVGSSLNFPIQNGDTFFDARAIGQECLERRVSDPLLLSWASSTCPIRAGIAAAVATGLSQPLLRRPPAGGLRVTAVPSWQNHLAAQARPTDRVCQIGFGGSTDIFARHGSVARFVVCDLTFADEDEVLRAHQALRDRGLDPGSVIFQRAGGDSPELATADIVCISGSTLCNATLDGLLSQSRKARVVALQGPSCSLYAPCLYRAGVTCVYAPLKQDQEWALAARRDPLLDSFVDGDYVAVSCREAMS